MQGRGPTEITVSSENQNLHFTRVFTQAPRLLRSRYTFIMRQNPEFQLWGTCNRLETRDFLWRRSLNSRLAQLGDGRPRHPSDQLASPQRACRSPDARVIGRSMAARIDSSGPTTMSRSRARVTAV